MDKATDRGRESTRPRQIPKAGWRDILLRTYSESNRDHVSMVAAGVAFYGLLALFPAIAALVSLWGLMFDPQTMQQQLDQVTSMLPDQAASIITTQGQSVASGQSSGFGIAAIGGFALTLYSASRGIMSLIEGLNMIYDEEEKRGFIKLYAVAIGLTLAIIVTMICTLALIAIVPAFLGNIGLPGFLQALATYLRWPILALVAVVGLSVLYRFGPSRSKPQWSWVSWGAGLATVVWLIGSALFSVYVNNFGSYNQTYGSLGAVIILLMWFWLSAYIVLMGAEMNSEMEHQTRRDTTDLPRQPMGERGAHAADTLGRER